MQAQIDEAAAAGSGLTTPPPGIDEAAQPATAPETETEHANGDTTMLIEIVTTMKGEIAELRAQLATKAQTEQGKIINDNYLKPVDMKNIEKPSPYDNTPAKFEQWYEKLSHLMMNCDKKWKVVLRSISSMGTERIGRSLGVIMMADIGDMNMKNIMIDEIEDYEEQLKAYLRN